MDDVLLSSPSEIELVTGLTAVPHEPVGLRGKAEPIALVAVERA